MALSSGWGVAPHLFPSYLNDDEEKVVITSEMGALVVVERRDPVNISKLLKVTGFLRFPPMNLHSTRSE